LTNSALNIGIFTESYTPYVNGVTVSVTTFAESLRRRGHTVHIFTPFMPGYEDNDPFVHRYPSVRFNWLWLQYEPDYVMAIGRAPGLQYILRWFFRAEVFKLRERGVLDRYIEDLPLDLIHTQSPFAMGAEGRRWANRKRIPHISTFHTLYTEYTHYTPFIPRPISLRFILNWTRKQYNTASVVIAPTESARDVLRSWGVHRPISILATGIHIGDFQGGDRAGTREKLEIPADALALLYAGRMAPEKNIPLLLDAFRTVRAKRPDAVLVFAGGGPDMELTRKVVAEGGYADCVRFPGYIPHEKMRDYYAAADVMTCPSHTETQGLALCEAMAAGLPFISVESPGALSVVPQGYLDYLIPADADTMADRVLSLAGDPAERARLADLGRETAHLFSAETAGEKLLKIYGSVVS